eukprot:1158804-Pelagomonas_calceolata.AAC.3
MGIANQHPCPCREASIIGATDLTTSITQVLGCSPHIPNHSTQFPNGSTSRCLCPWGGSSSNIHALACMHMCKAGMSAGSVKPVSVGVANC